VRSDVPSKAHWKRYTPQEVQSSSLRNSRHIVCAAATSRAEFHAGEAIAAIAAAHERKIGAITARLIRLGLITEDGVVQPD
jgi:hypothetical protein